MDATIIPIGLLRDPFLPFGSNVYNAWAGGAVSQTFDIIRELDDLVVPAVCCPYYLTMRWIHGGGMEGLAFNPAKKQPLASSTFKVTHALPTGGVYSSGNPPTGVETVSTDSVGFWRTMFYDVNEKPKVKGLRWPLEGGSPAVPSYAYPNSGVTIGRIKEMAYNHFAASIRIGTPGVSNLGAVDGVYHMAGLSYDSDGNPNGLAYWRSQADCPGNWDVTGAPITSNDADENPSLMYDSRGRLYCLFDRQEVGSCLSWSDDDGLTWSDAVTTITNGTHSAIATGHDGSIVIMAYVDDGTGADTGTLQGFWQPCPE